MKPSKTAIERAKRRAQIEAKYSKIKPMPAPRAGYAVATYIGERVFLGDPRKYYKCPHCEHNFKPKLIEDDVAMCPNCITYVKLGPVKNAKAL